MEQSVYKGIPREYKRGAQLTTTLIGAGGWAYFHVSGEASLEAYSKAFDFVEVNSTFYEYPDMRAVRSWRRRVPANFEFTVRCHQDIAHRNKLGPSDVNMASLERVLDICETLKAPVLHILVPQAVEFTNEVASKVRDLLGSVGLGQVRVALEIARGRSESLDPYVTKVMQDMGIVHSVDLSQEEPAYKSDLLYARLFGSPHDNVYQFTDQELQEIDTRASRPEFEKSILAFHGVKMYKDAARLKSYRNIGVFPMVTSHVGLESLQEVLSEDQEFPASKATLVERQGWKIIDLTAGERVPAAKALQKLPDREYLSTNDVVATLKDQGMPT